MAAVHTRSASHTRHRSASDPFSDPAYTIPHLAAVPRSGPVPPPKHSTTTTTTTTTGATTTTTPTSRHPDTTMIANPSMRVHESARTRMHRSQTAIQPIQDTRPPVGHSRRSHSQDSVVRAAAAIEKNKASMDKSKGGQRKTHKPGSSHADVIDRLDFSGVGPMFHHDGPFDACAPSRNRHRTKAPMLAWAPGHGDEDALNKAYTPGANERPYAAPRGKAYEATPVIPYEPKKKVDALAEAWGTHEPEPYEEFFAGGGNGPSRPPSTHSRNSAAAAAAAAGAPASTGRRSKDNAKDLRERYRGAVDDVYAAQHPSAPAGAPRRSREKKRTTIPPPQPIFVGDAEGSDEGGIILAAGPPSPTANGVPRSPGGPKRSKSLMQRIRKMRDNPNVPAGAAIAGADGAYESDYGSGAPPPVAYNGGGAGAPPPVAGRPGHRSQRSFLGRVVSPGREEPYVIVDEQLNKNLPDTPRSPPADNYFDDRYAGGVGGATPTGGLGRKTSLMKRAKGLMRGGK